MIYRKSLSCHKQSTDAADVDIFGTKMLELPACISSTGSRCKPLERGLEQEKQNDYYMYENKVIPYINLRLGVTKRFA